MIKVIDNFFSKKLLKKIQSHITTNIYYTPRWLDGWEERTKESYYGDRFVLNNDLKLKQTFVKQAENKFKIKIKKLNNDSGIDLRNLDHFQPHTDPFKINILIMLYGPIAVTNGTVFFDGSLENNPQLDMHVGFKPNRAILFPSNKVHSPHKSNIPNLRRYTASLFIEDYEE